jgi:hypothetical protein
VLINELSQICGANFYKHKLETKNKLFYLPFDFSALEAKQERKKRVSDRKIYISLVKINEFKFN